MKKLMLVTGARPNFVKVAPLIRKITQSYDDRFSFVLVHTGQHYDREMSENLFIDLGIPNPDYNLEVGSSSHSIQTAHIMERFEPLCAKEDPDCIVVFGDVNSTLASALVGAKNHIPVAHVEAGLRSFDRSMPEEINRIVTDILSDFLFTPDAVADENLIKEGIPRERIFRVGDIMVDALLWEKNRAGNSKILDELGINDTSDYGVLTLHRAGNVDSYKVLSRLVDTVTRVSSICPLVFPVHPRTGKRLKEFKLSEKLERFRFVKKGDRYSGILMVKSVSYTDFLKLIMDSKFVLTDSGGIQKETTVLGVDCLTLRDTTEWPMTVSHGSNRLLGRMPDVSEVVEIVRKVLSGEEKKIINIPELWDGQTSERILKALDTELECFAGDGNHEEKEKGS